MLTIPAELQARLDAGVTTLCWCWRVQRRDDIAFGFTDHDEDLEFGGLTYRGNSGFSGSDLEVRTGRESATGDVGGIFDDAAIEENDLRNGLWNGARVEVFRVDWSDPSSRVRTWTGEFGAVSHDGTSFKVSIHGLSRRLERSIGRLYSRHCDASFGDARCGIDASTAQYSGSGAVMDFLPSGLVVSGLETFPAGWFNHGWLDWMTGAASGRRSRVASHTNSLGQTLITLMDDLAEAQTGDTFSIVAGCDKRHATCRDKFANIENFRGFAFMPGTDVLTASPASERDRDGGSRGAPS